MWLTFCIIFLHCMCQWKIEILIFFLRSIPSRVEPHSMCGVLSTLNIQLPIHQGRAILIRTAGRFISCNFIRLSFISFSAFLPSRISLVLLPPSTIILVIFSILFICFNHLWIILVLVFPKTVVASAYLALLCISLYEPVVISAKIMVVGDCLIKIALT